MPDFDLDSFDFDLDFSPKEPDRVTRPEWYYEDDVAPSFKAIVDQAVEAFEEKLAFIHGLKPGTKVKVKDRKLVAAKLNEAAGLRAGYLRNTDRPDVARTVDFIRSLNARLEAAFDAKPAENIRPTASDLKSEVQALREKVRKLESIQFGEYAAKAFQEEMYHRLESNNHSQASLFRKNEALQEENAELRGQNEKLRKMLTAFNSEISRLRDQAKTKSNLKVVDNG